MAVQTITATPGIPPGVCNRESADEYPSVVTATSTHRVIVCKDGLQWIIQRKRGKSLVGGAWRSISYCTTRRALIRLWTTETGKTCAALAALRPMIGGCGAR